MVFETGGRWPHSCCCVGCCYQNLYMTACSILVHLLSKLFSTPFVSVHVVHPYSSRDTTAAWKKWYVILSDTSDLHITNSLSIAVYAFACRVLTSFSEDITVLPRNVNNSFRTEMPHFFILIKAHVFCFVRIDMEAYAACCLLQTM